MVVLQFTVEMAKSSFTVVEPLTIYLVIKGLNSRACTINCFTAFTDLCNKLDCLSLASLSSLVECLWVRPGASYPRVEHLTRKHCTRLERLARDKHSSLLQKPLITAVKSFIVQAPAASR